MEDRKNLKVKTDILRELKIIAARRDIPMQDLADGILDDFIKKTKKGAK